MLVILKVSVNVARGWLDFRNESRKGNKSEVSILSNFLDEKLNIKTRLVITPTFFPDEKISSRMIKHQKLKFGALFRSEFHLLALLLTWRFRLCAFCSQSGKQTIGKQFDHKYHILSISYKKTLNGVDVKIEHILIFVNPANFPERPAGDRVYVPPDWHL